MLIRMKKIILFSLIFILAGCNLIEKIPGDYQPIDESGLLNSADLNDNQNLNESTDIQQNQIVCQSQTIEDKNTDYSIAANYPVCDMADKTKKEILNNDLSKTIKDEISNFKETLDQGAEPLPNIANTFDASYKITYASESIFSLYFTIATYYNGAAHPNQYYLVYNYDLNKMSKIQLADLFKTDAKYLEKFSELCKIEFIKKFTDAWFTEGCDPKKENFINFVILPDSLKILIDPYQVAPYVEGPQELNLKYSDLKDLIKTAGVLTEFIK